MSIGSFSAGLSGLNANSQYLNVIGNNLANINTVGFKASTVTFSDLVSQTLGGSSTNPMQVGLGVMTGAIEPSFSQGSIENTKEATNVAIQGNGFFAVRTANDGIAYTRAGNFTFNHEGKLVSPDGAFVQGYTTIDPLTGQVITTGQTSDLLIPPGTLRPPVPTSKFNTMTNLDASAIPGNTFTAPIQIFDPLGGGHVATVTYTKGAGAGSWNYDVTVPGEDVTGPVAIGAPPAAPVSIKSGSVVFGPTGLAATIDGAPPADVTIVTPVWFNGAASTTINWDIVDAAGVSSLTGFASTSATSSKSQDGSAAGKVDNITISADGTIEATFAGKALAVGQLALASFNNPKGLVKFGVSKYGETQSSGSANLGEAGTGGRGTMIGFALEQSNVDIAQEFTQMILAQRGYQANSKMITVSDEILMDTLNLKR